MTATYPSTVRQFTAKVDIQDTILADHVNSLQDEVRAVETTLGTSLLTSSYSGSFAQTTTWTSLSARIANIETGLINGTGSGSFVSTTGGSTITSAGSSVGLAIQPASGNISNQITFKNSSGVLGFAVDYLGIPKVGTYNVLYVNSTEYNSLSATVAAASASANAATTAANANPLHPFLLSGM